MLAAILHDDFQSYFGVVKYVMNSVIQEIWQTDIVRILNSIVYAARINWSITYAFTLAPVRHQKISLHCYIFSQSWFMNPYYSRKIASTNLKANFIAEVVF